jgi:hypothetical protein
MLILSQSELKKEKRQQAGAKEKSLLTAERKKKRERERERERERNCDRKSGLEGRAESHTLKKKQSRRTSVSS